MTFIAKKVVSWEIKYGQIGISGKDNIIARDLFKDFFGKSFKLETFKGTFSNINFNEKTSSTSLRLSCSEFFKKLKPETVIYLRPKDTDTVEILEKEPTEIDSLNPVPEKKKSKFNENELLEIIASLTRENQQLRESNSSLFPYKEQIDKYQSLQKIFNDEKFMEDWLERNIHIAIADLEIIDRQPIITWPVSKLKNRLDFFCVDKTTRELVIVENKVRGNKTTIETQYMSYKTWVSENLSLINEKYIEKNINATENFKFVIITDFNDERLEALCRHFKITLILIDGGVLFEPLGYPYGGE